MLSELLAQRHFLFAHNKVFPRVVFALEHIVLKLQPYRPHKLRMDGGTEALLKLIYVLARYKT